MEFDHYPEKPELVEEKSSSGMFPTVFSIVLFALAFYFIISDQWLFIFNLLIVLIIHELGHFVMMKIFGYQDVRMLFVPLMGAFVQGSKSCYSQKQSLLVIVLGPYPGMLIGFLLCLISGLIRSEWLLDLGVLFLFINLLNLLPIDPLDGGQMLKLLFIKAEDLFLLLFSFISSIFLILLGFLMDEYFLMIFGFLMAFRVRKLQQQYHLRKRLKQENINYTGCYSKLSNRDYYHIKNVLLEENPRLRIYKDVIDAENLEEYIANEVDAVLKDEITHDAGFTLKWLILTSWFVLLTSPLIIYFLADSWLREYFAWYVELI